MNLTSVFFLWISIVLHFTILFFLSFFKSQTTSELSFRPREYLYEINGSPRNGSLRVESDDSHEKNPGPMETTPSGDVASEEGTITDGSELGLRAPLYPRQSRLNGEEGSVLLGVMLVENLLCEVKVLESSGFERLDNAALLSIRNGLQAAHDCSGAYTKRIRFRFGLK